jgi:DNA repair protein RecN (Recombination protein N)
MISSLSISNYALIREIEIKPVAGLNIITGETGAGKSIMMGALSLLQGRRADLSVVNNPAEKAVVEAVFELDADTAKALHPILQEAEVTENDGYCILRREILPSGRSRAFVNDVPATLPVLEQISAHLIDIHSQHKNLLLADSSFQLSVLDKLAENEALLAQYHGVYADYRKALRRYVDARDSIERTRADADYLEYQLDEIDHLQLVADEDTELAERREALEAASAIGSHLVDAADALMWADGNAVQQVKRAIDALADVSEISAEFRPLLDRLQVVKVELADIADSVALSASGVRDDSQTLEDIDDRLGRLNQLMSKHKVDSVNALIAKGDDMRRRLAEAADADNVLGSLEQAARALKKQAVTLATELSQRRSTAAHVLEQKICERAMPLGLDNLVCNIAITVGKLNADGHDTIEFLFAFNKNQQPMPIGDTASGGEISRVMLALKSILADHIHLPTIIFDEIDTGVSGDVAARMGALMAAIGSRMQVITITHLPPVAARGAAHFKVYKRDNDTSTQTYIAPLSPAERRMEIALMLSGNADDPAALATADSLLNQH